MTALSAVMLFWPGETLAQWRFIVTSDSRGLSSGVNQVILGELAEQITRQDVDFVLFLGDLVYGRSQLSPAAFEAQLRTWVDIMKPVYEAKIPVYVCRGNHELGDNWDSTPLTDPNDNYATRWLRVFGSDAYPVQKVPDNGPQGEKYMTYSVTHKNALLVLLDQFGGTRHVLEHKANLAWLDAQLAANTKPHVFVGGHEQAFRALHPDCLDNQPAARDALWACIASAGGRTYFCGHDHFYDHARVDDGDGDPNDDVHQYIIGTAGAIFYTWSPPYSGNNSHYSPQQQYHARRYGYVLVEVDNLDVSVTWTARNTNDLDVAGTYTAAESWRYSVAPGPILLSPNGAENLVAQSTRTISWKTTEGAAIDEVLIEYSCDDGMSWEEVAIYPNTGSYEWLIPSVDSNECLLRISDLYDADAGDTSDGTFTIFRCREFLPGDLNGDCYVDFEDYALLVDGWLKCGNPFDPSCERQ